MWTMDFREFIKKTIVGKMILNYKAIKRTERHKEEIRETIKKMGRSTRKHILYCGICESSNMGDIAQTYCTLKWLERTYSAYEIVLCKSSCFMDDKCSFIDELLSVVKEDDIFVFQSGYNTHDLGGYEDFMHQKVITAFPNNEIIMLPQTVYFKSKERENLCSNVYDSHKHMIFLARDPVSEKLAKRMFPHLKVLLFPDIVTSLIGKFDTDSMRHDIYLCRRHDVEQFYDDRDYLKCKSILEEFDRVDVSDTIISVDNDSIYDDLEKNVFNMIDRFAKYRLVVTDKFHGLIFALVANTPVIVLKTKDHKVTSGCDWFNKVYPDRVFYAETIENVKSIAKMVLDNPSYSKLDDYFDREYYQKLSEILENWEEEVGK